MNKAPFLRYLMMIAFIIVLISLNVWPTAEHLKVIYQSNNLGIVSANSKNPQEIESISQETKTPQEVHSVQFGEANFSDLAQKELINPPVYNLLAIHPPEEDIDEEENANRNFPVPEKFANLPAATPMTSNAISNSNGINPLVVSPAPTTSFLAVGDSGPIPPDTHGAVGPNHLVVAVNGRIRIQDRTGRELKSVSLDGFWQMFGFNGATFDPKIFYDAARDRWVIITDANAKRSDSAIYIAVTLTGDPTQMWRGYNFRTDNTGTNWADYPSIGFNDTMVVFTHNFFGVSDGRFKFTSIYVLSKNTLYSGAGNITAQVFADDTNSTSVPATTYDSGVTIMYLVSTFNSNFNGKGFLRLDKITGTPEAPLLTRSVAMPSSSLPWSSSGPGAPQSGTSNRIDTGDHRMLSVLLRNGRIWCTHSVFFPAGSPNRSAVQVWQFLTDGTITQLVDIQDSSGNISVAYPSIAVNRNEDVLVGFSIFGQNFFASGQYSFRFGTDPANSFRDGTTLKAGENSYFKDFGTGKNRWGDYSNTVVDPNGVDFWTIQEYASSTSNNWSTWWGQISPNGQSTSVNLSVNPSPQSVTAGNSAAYTINLNRSNFSGVVSLSIGCPSSGCPQGLTVDRNLPINTTNNAESIRFNTTSATPIGTYVFSVTGAANGVTIPSTSLTLQVTPPMSSVSLSVNPSPQSVTAGNSAAYTINLNRSNFSGVVSLSIGCPSSGCPQGLTVDRNLPINTTNNTESIRFNTTSATPIGTYVFSVTGTANGVTIPSTSLTLQVTPPTNDFNISINPINTFIGSKVSITVNISRINNNGTITVDAPSFSVLDSLKLKLKSSSSVSTTGSSATFVIKVKPTASTGTKNLTFTARDSSGRVKTANLTLSISN